MTTFRLIILRLFSISLGRIPYASLCLKKLLIFFLIKKKSAKYVASSGYFDYRQFKIANDQAIAGCGKDEG